MTRRDATGQSPDLLADLLTLKRVFSPLYDGKEDLRGFQRDVADYSPAMPLYEYELCDGHCAACGGKFTLRRPVSAPDLKGCPACKRPIRKVISAFNTPSITKPVSHSDAKKAGFTVLKRVGKGEYERQ